MAFIFFSSSNFSSMVGLKKEDKKQNRGMNIVKIVDKVDKEDKLVENWTGGGESPLTL